MRLIIIFISILTFNSVYAQTKNKSLFYSSQKIDFLHFFNYSNRQVKVDTNALYTNANYNLQYGNAQLFGLLYKQKLNSYLDLQLNLIKFSREGLLQNEEIKNHEFDLIAHFSNKLDNYKSHIHFGSEKYLIQENGGVLNIANNSVSDPAFYSVPLSQALNSGHNHFYSYNQSYQLSDNVKLVNNSNYFRKYRIYEDSNPNSNFYPNIYNDSTSTFDSTYFSSFTNQIGIEVQNLQLSYVYKNYSNWHASNDSVFVDNGLSFQAQFSPKQIDIGFNLEYYTSTSYFSSLSVSLPDSNLLLSIGSQKPLIPVFTNSYFSNHFQFNTNFTDYRKHSTSLVYQLKKLKISSVLNAHHNFVYLNEKQLFVQNTDIFYHSKSTIDYKWNLGLLNGHHSFSYQFTSNDQVFRVPSLRLYSDLYLNTLLFDASLDLKVGSTVSFFTSYYGNRYSPALAQFYLQNDQLIGDYPFVTAYANLMVESVNVEFQLVNILDLFSDKLYYIAPDIPYFGSPFQLSISWKLD